MKCYLKKLNYDIGDLEYLMYQEMPLSENGAINTFKSLDLISYNIHLKERIDEEFKELSLNNTPRITYILYDDNYPIGEVMIRPKLNSYWKMNSGNIGYKIRPTKRKQGYGKMILHLALQECKKLGMKEIFLQCFNNNEASKRIIESNGGIIEKNDGYVCSYKIKI